MKSKKQKIQKLSMVDERNAKAAPSCVFIVVKYDKSVKQQQ